MRNLKIMQIAKAREEKGSQNRQKAEPEAGKLYSSAKNSNIFIYK